MMRNTTIIEKVEVKETINKIIEELLQADFSSSESNSLLRAYDVPKDKKIYEYIAPIKEKIDNLIRKIYNCKIIADMGLAVLKYENGSFIDMHRDWEPNDPYVLKYGKQRVDLGCVFYINDDYVGGELMFFNGKYEPEPYMKIKPNYATCVIFDSSIYHMTAPTTSGTKYSLTIFYQIEENEQH